MICSCLYIIRRGLIYQTHRFIYRINNVGLINQAPTDESSPTIK